MDMESIGAALFLRVFFFLGVVGFIAGKFAASRGFALRMSYGKAGMATFIPLLGILAVFSGEAMGFPIGIGRIIEIVLIFAYGFLLALRLQPFASENRP